MRSTECRLVDTGLVSVQVGRETPQATTPLHDLSGLDCCYSRRMLDNLVDALVVAWRVKKSLSHPSFYGLWLTCMCFISVSCSPVTGEMLRNYCNCILIFFQDFLP